MQLSRRVATAGVLAVVAATAITGLSVLVGDARPLASFCGVAAALFALIRRLKAQGVTIVYISHRLEEVLAISDRITVLRDGKFIATRRPLETTADEIIHIHQRPHLFHLGR